MLFNIAWNELRYMLKSPQTYVAFAIFFCLPFYSMVNDNFHIGAGGNVNVNSPFAIMQMLMILNVFGVFVIPAFIANAVLKDHENKIDGIIYSTPITKPAYLFGRFFGAFAALFIVMTATPIGMLAGTFWPTVDPETLAPTNLYHYAYIYCVLVGSSMLVISSIIFAIATLTRSIMYTYIGAMGLLVVYFIAISFFSGPEFRETMTYIDPFMLRALTETSRYWTAIERNTLLLTFEGATLNNRLIWGGISVAMMALSYRLFSFRAPAKQKKEKQSKTNDNPIVECAPRIMPQGSAWGQFLMRTRFEVGSVLKSVPFMIIVGFTLVLVLSALLNRNVGFGVDAIPVTRLMVQGLQGLSLAFVTVIIFYSADIIWREHKDGVHEIIDATSVPNLVFVASKLIALAVVLIVILLVGIGIGIAVQIVSETDAIELDLYLSRGFLHFIYPFLLISILSVFVQVVFQNRFVGMMVMVIYMIGRIILSVLGFEHPLYFYGSNIPTPLSDLNGSGRYIEADIWLQTYWSFFAVLLVMMSYMLWNRGTLQPLSLRIRRFVAFKRPIAVGLAAVSFAGFVTTGGFIFYNTNILNKYLTRDDLEQAAVEYEARFRQYENLPQPRTVAVKMDVDIYPYEQRVDTRGFQILENKTDVAIDTVHMVFSPRIDEITRVELQGGAIESVDDFYNYYIFTLETPMQPGDKRELNFDIKMDPKGFAHSRNSVTLVRNGTFINGRDVAPYIGFAPRGMLQDRNTRRQYGLEPLPRKPKLEDASQYGSNAYRQDSDFISFETTVSTVGSQTAIAPGYLQREWQDNGRNYYHYKMDSPIQNSISYLSADYEVVREDWNGIVIEVYHHAPHTYNVGRMIESVKDSISYFSEAFSPYQYKQLRIMEFPAYRRFAQAFPNTVPYSEGIGFIADLTDEEDIDLAYYVTAHEIAHQWWGHQLVPANTQGATMLDEALAQYSALLVMERKYGKNQMRKFLKFELDRYLQGRAGDAEGELPLYKVENQDYIHYRKGSMVMYALKDYLGEDVVNRALSRLVEERGFSSTPYAISLDFCALCVKKRLSMINLSLTFLSVLYSLI